MVPPKLEGLGRYPRECGLYQADDSDTTVLLSPEDFADGELYMFKGKQPQTIPMIRLRSVCAES